MMIIWTSGIIESEVNSAFFNTRIFFQDRLDTIALNNNFGASIEKIRVVFIINRDPITEYRRFSKKDKTLDARVRLHYEEFLGSSPTNRIKMFAAAFESVIQNIKNFAEQEFCKNELVKAIREIA